MELSRRDILKYSTILAASSAINGCSSKLNQTNDLNQKKVQNNFAKLPKTNKPIVVVVGGGWSGLSVAKNTKLLAPNCEVILVEQRDHFVSCPLSNLWLVDKVSLEYLTYDYLQAGRENNYTYFHATALNLDKENNILYTSNGDIKYDHIVFAPGIDYDYSLWTNDIALENRLRSQYPAAFIPGSEHLTLKNKIKNFTSGNFVMTVPGGNYRCLPAPYERACIIADYFKSKKLKAKVILLDENNDITIKEQGFHTAFNELYADYIDYRPNSKIENINLDEKLIETEFEEFTFDDASFYPHIRGGKILEKVGISKDTIYNKHEGNIDFISYEVVGHSNIYVSGDARPMGFSKSGNTSNSEGAYLAQLIANKINKVKPIKWRSPLTICFSAVSIYPERAIYIHSAYAYDKKKNSFYFDTPISSENWKSKDGLDNAKGLYNWADSMFIDMFKG
jgi:NADH dehydrogenase FAD-containing subunit